MRERWTTTGNGLRSDDSGVALITVLMAIVMISAVTTLLLTQAIRQLEQAEFAEREDIVLAGTEALLERYATKMTLDPLYYLHTVDEAERTRRCQTTSSVIYNTTVDPGNAWSDDCTAWTYEDTPDADTDGEPDWWTHPLLAGTDPNDDVATLLEVTPPSAGQALTVGVVGRRGNVRNQRMITASISATSLSEFFRVTENDLNYGADAVVYGKIYSGDDVNFSCSSGCGDLGVVHNHVFAEDEILQEPTKNDPSVEFYDDVGEHNSVRDVFAQPLDFSNFWDDLELLATVACDSGLCLDDASTDAWMIHPYMSGTDARVRIWRTTSDPTAWCSSGSDSVNEEEFFWLTPEDAAVTWTLWGDHPVPTNGAIWANAHVVVGSQTWTGAVDFNGTGGKDSVVGQSMSIYAGTATQRMNVIINGDIYYDDPTSYDTIGLIASDEVILNPNATGTDAEFHINASLLGQYAQWQVGRSCGDGGDPITPSGSELWITGSIATPSTGDAGSHFYPRNYGFDDRLEYLRPPFFPLLDNNWNYENWREVSLPDWAK